MIRTREEFRKFFTDFPDHNAESLQLPLEVMSDEIDKLLDTIEFDEQKQHIHLFLLRRGMKPSNKQLLLLPNLLVKVSLLSILDVIKNEDAIKLNTFLHTLSESKIYDNWAVVIAMRERFNDFGLLVKKYAGITFTLDAQQKLLVYLESIKNHCEDSNDLYLLNKNTEKQLINTKISVGNTLTEYLLYLIKLRETELIGRFLECVMENNIWNGEVFLLHCIPFVQILCSVSESVLISWQSTYPAYWNAIYDRFVDYKNSL